jgi:hypothetical protein
LANTTRSRPDEFGMIQNAGLAEAFVRKMWHDGAEPPVWFPDAYTAHARETMSAQWEAKVSAYR